MGAARKLRTEYVREDAAEGSWVFAIMPEDVEVPIEESWPSWRCNECNQTWDGIEIACGYCGSVREDIDQCV